MLYFYRLEEDGKVLTPEEVLYKAVHAVSATHDAVHAQMDVKLRSLICCGLKYGNISYIWRLLADITFCCYDIKQHILSLVLCLYIFAVC